jgi:hypothetical protein
MRASEGALNGAEELALDEFARERRAIDLDDVSLTSGAEGMNQIRDDFLTGAALTGDQDSNVAGCDALDRAHDITHRRALEHGRSGAADSFNRAAEYARFFVLAFVLDGVLDVGKELLGVELRAFAEEIERPQLRCFNGPGDGFILVRSAGKDDDLGFAPALLELRQEFKPVGVGQFHIQQDQVRLLQSESLLERCPTVRLKDLVFVSQQRLEQLSQGALIIDNQDLALHKSGLPPAQVCTKARKIDACSSCRSARRSGWNCTPNRNGSAGAASSRSSRPRQCRHWFGRRPKATGHLLYGLVMRTIHP